MKHRDPARSDLPKIFLVALTVFGISFIITSVFLIFFSSGNLNNLRFNPLNSSFQENIIDNKNTIALNNDTKVPEPQDKLSDKSIAVPMSAAPISKNNSRKYRNFEITATKNEFVPSKIIAHKDDIISIKLTAKDDNYSLFIPSIGILLDIEKGNSQIAQFQAVVSGVMEFYGDNNQASPKGYILIVPPQKNVSNNNSL